jgi:hypothetical protein
MDLRRRNMVLVQLDEHHRPPKQAHFTFDEDRRTDIRVLRVPAGSHRPSDDVSRVYKVVLRMAYKPLRTPYEPLRSPNERLYELNACRLQDAKALREGNGRNSFEISVLRRKEHTRRRPSEGP